MDTLEAALASQETGPTESQALVVASQTPAATGVRQAQLQVIQTARAIRRYVNARRL